MQTSVNRAALLHGWSCIALMDMRCKTCKNLKWWPWGAISDLRLLSWLYNIITCIQITCRHSTYLCIQQCTGLCTLLIVNLDPFDINLNKNLTDSNYIWTNMYRIWWWNQFAIDYYQLLFIDADRMCLSVLKNRSPIVYFDLYSNY